MFAERRKRLCSTLAEGTVVILVGSGNMVRSNDTEFPFRQDSDLHYLTGFDHPNAVAILNVGRSPNFTLFVEPKNQEMETWTGYRPGVEGAIESFGADQAFPIEELQKRLPEILSEATSVYHVLGKHREVDDQMVSILNDMRIRSRSAKTPAAQIVDPRSIIHEMRVVKDPTELELMRAAASITKEAHRYAASLSFDGTKEYEIEAALSYVFRKKGASGPAYTSIVGSGSNATTLHYVRNEDALKDSELVLIDAGCEYQGYASDVTRTYPIGGHFNGARRAVYSAVLEAQAASIEASQPGATLQEVHDASVQHLSMCMIDLGLLSGSLDEVIEQNSYRRFYMHNTSHWLGLDVHDAGNYSIDGKPRKLLPGMVYTVEPGLYIRSDDEEVPQEFRGIGVRIEDDIHITESGIEILTADIPKEPSEVEEWVLTREFP
ncbi:aminopeptidase P N-terminal domain-containing protein [Myxococcota bacterium]|nr:aminopeptidase P N-terminal domain-containing protein [Myxococcota bacterium]